MVTKHSDTEYIASLNGVQFDPYTPNGNPNMNTLRSEQAKVTCPKGSIIVEVVDKCPGCRYGDLDLSKAAFKVAVGDLIIGLVQISWQWLLKIVFLFISSSLIILSLHIHERKLKEDTQKYFINYL